MSARITGVAPGSPADLQGLRPGDLLLSVNGHEICDVLDYRFYMVENTLVLRVRKVSGQETAVTVEKDEYEDPGLSFETYLMDQKHSCRNRCVFCFIDQLPPGLRESLYFKDDDARLSFLMGNYITLTNLSPREVERITQMHLSPVNVSVHTTDPELRVKMMGNKNAGRALEILAELARHRISLNCQIVLCRGYNDGPALCRTLGDLLQLPTVESIAVVPVGLTRYRAGLTPLVPFGREESRAVLDTVDEFARGSLEKRGRRVVFAADEFYLKAGVDVPDADFYEDFSQLENGVGLIADLTDSFERALAARGKQILASPRNISVATGKAAGQIIQKLTEKACKSLAGLHCLVYAIENRFFGGGVDVAGLVTGRDLISSLKGAGLTGELLIPSVMLRREGDLFLDGLTPGEVAKELGVKVTPVPVDGEALLTALAGPKS